MDIASEVAKVLRSVPANSINFTVANIAINKMRMELVAKAIEAQDISVEIGNTGSRLGAAYSSFVGRRLAAGEKKLIGRITLGSDGTVRSILGKASILHESVHALMDVCKIPVPSMQNDEVVAYLADALYLRATSTKVSGGAQEMAIFNAAFAIVDGHKMLAKPGTALKWGDCEALLNAIKAHPAYR